MSAEAGTEPGARAGAGGGNSVHALARLLRISERRVQQLVREGTLPRPDARGQYNAAACVHAYIGFLQFAARRPGRRGRESRFSRSRPAGSRVR